MTWRADRVNIWNIPLKHLLDHLDELLIHRPGMDHFPGLELISGRDRYDHSLGRFLWFHILSSQSPDNIWKSDRELLSDPLYQEELQRSVQSFGAMLCDRKSGLMIVNISHGYKCGTVFIMVRNFDRIGGRKIRSSWWRMLLLHHNRISQIDYVYYYFTMIGLSAVGRSVGWEDTHTHFDDCRQWIPEQFKTSTL